jgi:hypothetical protein
VIGWKLERTEREALLKRFAPTWPDVIADHVTLRRAPADEPLPLECSARIVGWVDDGEGLQALVVELDGTTDRPDGSTYHITWSLDRERGRRAVQSNEVLARLGWTALSEPVPVSLEPTRWD